MVGDGREGRGRTGWEERVGERVGRKGRKKEVKERGREGRKKKNDLCFGLLLGFETPYSC